MFGSKNKKRDIFFVVVTAFLFMQYASVHHAAEDHLLNHYFCQKHSHLHSEQVDQPFSHNSDNDHSEELECDLFQFHKTAITGVKNGVSLVTLSDPFEAVVLQYFLPSDNSFNGFISQTRAPPVS